MPLTPEQIQNLKTRKDVSWVPDGRGNLVPVFPEALSPELQTQYAPDVPTPTPTPTALPPPPAAPKVQAEQASVADRPKKDWAFFEHPAEQPANMPEPPKAPTVNDYGIGALESKYNKSVMGSAKNAEDFYNQTATVLEAQNKAAEDFEVRRQQREADRQQKQDAAVNMISEAGKEYDTAQVDPNRYWKEKSTAGKITSAIAISLGAVGDALMRYGTGSGPGNTALALFEKAIDQDIDAQKTELNKKGTKIGNMTNLYKVMLDRFGDERAADAATRAALYDKTKSQIDVMTAKLNSSDAKYRAAQLSTDFGMKATGMRMEAAKIAVESEKARSAGQGNVYKQFIQGVGTGRTPEATDKAAETHEAYTTMMENLDKLEKLYATYGKETFDTDAKKAMTAYATAANLAMRKLYGVERITAATDEKFDKLLPTNPATIWDWNGAKEEIANAKAFGLSTYDNKMKTLMIDWKGPPVTQSTTFKSE